MAIVFGATGLDLDLSALNLADILAGTASPGPTTLDILAPSQTLYTITGEGFTYSPQVAIPVTGTIFSYQDDKNFILGLNTPVSQLLPAFQPTPNGTTLISIVLSGNDTVIGNDGNDNLFGYNGDDTVVGGSGNDSINGGFGFDTLFGGSGNDSILGGSNRDTVFGGVGNDTLRGGNGLDLVRGGFGNDEVFGGVGSDTVFGGLDDDLIEGGLGDDLLYGATGSDTFSYEAINVGTDIIGDFDEDDFILIKGGAFGGGLTGGALPEDAFVIGSTATTASHRFIYNSTTGGLFFDGDGTGSTAAVQLATLLENPTLTAAQIQIEVPAP